MARVAQRLYLHRDKTSRKSTGHRGRTPFWLAVFVSLACALPLFAREIEIVLLYTADVQGHLLSHSHREHPRYTGGLLRCATAIGEARALHENHLLLDCGSLLTGSPESQISEGRLPRQAAAWLRYDARLPDSSDWTTLPGDVASSGALVAANAESLPKALSAAGAAAPFRIFEIDGLRIAVIGLSEAGGAVSVSAGVPPLREIESALSDCLQDVRRESPQVVVVLLAAGPEPGRCTEQARKLAVAFPEIDLILGGGDGEVVRAAEWNGVVFSQAGRQGRWLGQATIRYDTVRGHTTRIDADLREIGPKVEEHSGLKRRLGKPLSEVEWELDRILARNIRELSGTSRWPGQSGVQRLLSEAFSRVTEADVVLLDKQARASLAAGSVRVGDVFRLLPDSGDLLVLQLLPADIRRVLEENLTLMGDPAFFGVHGLSYHGDPEAPPGQRISGLLLSDGESPHGRKRLRLVVPAQAMEGHLEARTALRRLADDPRSRVQRLEVDARTALLDYLEERDVIDLRPLKGLLASGRKEGVH